MTRRTIVIIVALFAPLVATTSAGFAPHVTVGAKHFNESYLLGEMMAQVLEHNGYHVDRKFSLGGTLICYEALRTGAIDVYPEYGGTLSREILKIEGAVNLDTVSARVRNEHLRISAPLGFNNTYAFAMRRGDAARLAIRTIGDLRAHSELRVAVSYEFLKRADGWEHVAQTYEIPQRAVGIEHGLAYEALRSGKIDVTDVYSTDGEIPRYDLTLLQDDRAVFPRYDAVAFYAERLDARAVQCIRSLEATLTDSAMQALNAEVVFQGKPFAQVAGEFLRARGIVQLSDRAAKPDLSDVNAPSELRDIFSKTLAHIRITLLALLAAIAVAVPLGVALHRRPAAASTVLYIAGLLQTIPSIALLALMIPLFGIGIVPAIVALFLYGLLPILRNTTTALMSVDPLLKDVATGMGMTSWQRMKFVEFPLAMPTIMAGVRTAAVITIGTATLAAFIGGGGLGEFIVTGLALNNTRMILSGAVPAGLLAVVAELCFEGIERATTPRHLRS
jgi:osmoprotectant transport system permease protein